MTTDLELLRSIFKDDRLHIGIGTIVQIGLNQSGGTLRVNINLLPENRQVIGEMTFADVTMVTFPEIDDLALVAFVDGYPDDCFVLKLVNTVDELIPVFAQTGNSVAYSRPGKKLYLGSDTKVGIGRPNVEPTSPLVLGDVLKTFLGDVLNAFLNASQIGECAVGPVFLDPTIRADLVSYINIYLTSSSTNILSQIGYVERGS